MFRKVTTAGFVSVLYRNKDKGYPVTAFNDNSFGFSTKKCDFVTYILGDVAIYNIREFCKVNNIEIIEI